jgi:poly(ADP-ribose) glycohydrolase ARH3
MRPMADRLHNEEMNAVPSEEQFAGCLLGEAVGDGLGAPYEGLPADTIYWMCGTSVDLVKNPTNDILYYTDDTQMMIGVAETLVDHGRIVEEALCQAFANNYQPERKYGRGARRVLEAMANDSDWRAIAANQFPGGSLGNGAAMRVAPVGLLFSDDLDRVWEEARLSALPTHVHPLGVEGAQILAGAVALATRQDHLDRKAFYRELLRRAHTEEFRWALEAAVRLRPGDTFGFLGNTLEAHRSVVTALACFTSAPRSYETAVAHALGQGDDTDTLAAMTGALSGAHLGVGSIPMSLLNKLENGSKGRTYLERLATGLYERYRSMTGTADATS